MQFGVYLVDNGVITCEDFFEVVKLQLRTRPPLGGLAIERRILTVRQVFTVLRQQCDAPADLFGELAVKAGYLTPEALSQLVHEQSLREKPFREILVETGILPAEVVAKHARDFRWTMEQHHDSQVVAANF